MHPSALLYHLTLTLLHATPRTLINGNPLKVSVSVPYRHEKKHAGFQATVQEIPISQIKESDPIFNYHRAKLSFGLLLMDINDAIREGDGQRLMCLYRISLLLYHCNGCTKYTYTTLLLLVKLNALLPEAQAFRLMWNRFCNSSGKKGGNISLDLRLEQLNNLLKACLKVLGANINEHNSQRLARAINSMESLLKSVDEDCNIRNFAGARGGKDPAETVSQIVSDLLENDVFSKTLGRKGYNSFKEFDENILNKLDYRKFYAGIKDKLKVWENMYDE